MSIKQYYKFDGISHSINVVENGIIVKRWYCEFLSQGFIIDSDYIGEPFEGYMRINNHLKDKIKEITEEEAFEILL